MATYLRPEQLSAVASEVREEFEQLMRSRRVVGRRQSKQWLFLRHCFEVAISGASQDFPCSPQQAVQYRFEVDDKLRRYYLTPGRSIPFILRLIHIRTALSLSLVDENYPSANGYVLLVSADSFDAVDTESQRELIERVIAEATDAEWQAYVHLPEVHLAPLERCFVIDGSAYRKVQFIVQRHHQRRWTISQPHTNPSTKRLMDVRVLKIDKGLAEVRTKEYWYLRWFDLGKRDYARIDWREASYQRYTVVRHDGRWLVESNEYPPPRGSAPYRKKILVG